MHSLAGQEHHGDPGIGHLDDAGNADSPTDQGNDDESVDARSNHCFSKGLDWDDAGAAGMELEDRVGGPSSVWSLFSSLLPFPLEFFNLEL